MSDPDRKPSIPPLFFSVVCSREHYEADLFPIGAQAIQLALERRGCLGSSDRRTLPGAGVRHRAADRAQRRPGRSLENCWAGPLGGNRASDPGEIQPARHAPRSLGERGAGRACGRAGPGTAGTSRPGAGQSLPSCAGGWAGLLAVGRRQPCSLWARRASESRSDRAVSPGGRQPPPLGERGGSFLFFKLDRICILHSCLVSW
jgi:hypothetical protein